MIKRLKEKPNALDLNESISTEMHFFTMLSMTYFKSKTFRVFSF